MRGVTRTFLLVVFVFLTASEGAPAIKTKHQRGTGLLQKQTSKSGTTGQKKTVPKGKPSIPKPLPSALAQREKNLSLSQETCRSPLSSNALFALSQDEHPVVLGQGIAFARLSATQQIVLQTQAATAPQVLAIPSHAIVKMEAAPSEKKLLVLASATPYRNSLSLWADGKETPIAPSESTHIASAQWSDDGRWIAFTANSRAGNDFDLMRYEVSSGATQPIALLTGYNEILDIAPDGSIALSQSQSVHRSQTLVWQAKTQKTLFIGPASEKEESRAAFTANSQGLFFLAEGESGLTSLYFANLSSAGEFRQWATKQSPIEYLKMDPLRKKLLYGVTHEGLSHFEAWELDPQGSRKRQLPVPKNPGVVLGLPAVTRNSKPAEIRFFYSASTSWDPARIWEWTGTRSVSWKSAPLGNPCFRKDQIVRYPSFDNTLIEGFFYSAQEGLAEKPALVLTMGKRFRPRFSAPIQYLTRMGFPVLAINARGSVGFGRTFQQADDLSHQIDAAKDVIAGATWLKAQPPAYRTAAMGFGEGSWLAAHAHFLAPKEIPAAVVVGNQLDRRRILEEMPGYFRLLWEPEYGGIGDKALHQSLALTPTQVRSNSLLQLESSPSPASLNELRNAVSFFETKFPYP